MTEGNERIQQMEAFFKNDAYAKFSGITIMEVTEDYAKVGAVISPQHINGNGCVHGGMLYTIADFAFAVLSNYLHPITVTQGGKIDYLRPGLSGQMTAVAKEKICVGRNSLCEVTVYDEKEEVLCICTFNGFIKDTNKSE